MVSCIFCNIQNPIIENDLALAFFDKNPVSKGHVLLVPKRHAQDYFELTSEEKLAMDDLLGLCKGYLDNLYKPDAYNIGANCGLEAGQTVFHCHVHLIPRYAGDMANPAGGVRGVIPEKQNYKD
jgi:diadenosine tetraphosphate (Ap4A) HIT family hydrolase